MPQRSENEWEQPRMVGWYDPFQLSRTAVQVGVSTILGTRGDYRVIEALSRDQGIFDYGGADEIWVDYVADLGDGWNPTYTIATLLARPTLEVRGSGTAYRTNRGSILIMGGDEVYPAASREEYRRRLEGPYTCALEHTEEPHPHLFAIPGNHDWYDGLVSFTRFFCQQRWIGGWKTRQNRSYFALKLAERWWLLGVDFQLESDIDFPQLKYFSRVAEEEMQEGDRVILCTAVPDWIYGNIYDKNLENNLAFLEKKSHRESGGKSVGDTCG